MYRYVREHTLLCPIRYRISFPVPYFVGNRAVVTGKLTHLWETGLSAADASVDGTPDVAAALAATVGAPLLLEPSVMSTGFPANLAEPSSPVPELGTTKCEEVG
jgi:hypothetical protein